MTQLIVSVCVINKIRASWTTYTADGQRGIGHQNEEPKTQNQKRGKNNKLKRKNKKRWVNSILS